MRHFCTNTNFWEGGGQFWKEFNIFLVRILRHAIHALENGAKSLIKVKEKLESRLRGP